MKKILILENGKSIKNLFNHENYEIHLSGDYEEAKSHNNIYDLVIADLTSIKNEKVELLMKLKNNPIISMVPFILITSKNGLESERGFSLFNYYLDKPFTKKDLLELIKKIFKRTERISPW
jgi:DNA-binding response OmpR family regulator